MIDKDEMKFGRIMMHYSAKNNSYCRICGELWGEDTTSLRIPPAKVYPSWNCATAYLLRTWIRSGNSSALTNYVLELLIGNETVFLILMPNQVNGMGNKLASDSVVLPKEA